MGSVNYKPNKRVARQILTSQLAYAAVNDGARKLRDHALERVLGSLPPSTKD